jgi:outer membrane protein assembly factor BamD
MRQQFARWMAVGLLAVLAGCATGSDSGNQTYADAAEQRYMEAQERLDSGDHIQAIDQFSAVRNRFPYSQYAALSDLRIGDAYFDQDKYASAVQQYRHFIRMHPNHGQVVYAHWRVALAFHELMPSDWWLLPPAYERDLAKSRDAARELDLFVQRYPDSEYGERARKLLAQTRRRLADHEMYVAEFYIERDNWRAASMRLRYLLENYSGLGLDPQALFLLARSYLELGQVERAKVALEDLIDHHPDTELAQQAKQYIVEHQL